MNHIGRMRVHLLFNSGRQFRFEHPDPLVFEFQFYRLGLHHRWILRPDRACRDDKTNRRYSCRNDESHGYEKALLSRQLQARRKIARELTLKRWAILRRMSRSVTCRGSSNEKRQDWPNE